MCMSLLLVATSERSMSAFYAALMTQGSADLDEGAAQQAVGVGSGSASDEESPGADGPLPTP
jgi:hypothetical protein